MYDWQAFLFPFSTPVKGIKQFHHFSFSHQAKGVIMATTHAEGPTQILPVLVGEAGAVPRAQFPGLSAKSQWYLFKSIRDFCTEDTKDIMCPKPTVQGLWSGQGSWSRSGQRTGARAGARARSRCTWIFRLRLRFFIYTRGGEGGNEERNGFPISIPVMIPITSPITTPITKDIAARLCRGQGHGWGRCRGRGRDRPRGRSSSR